MSFSAADHAFMARALVLTGRGRDTSTPNPNVGCVLAKDGRIIGEGWHARAGEPHAEIVALANATESAQGATVYVTLEPCAHQGRTGPCADKLVEARVARVVAALQDPVPQVNGRGLERLRAAGIAAETGLMEAQAREVHRGFLSRVTRGRPWMRIKAAASIDGRTAMASGESQWITGEAARRDVHALRARSCAMLTGIGTVMHDDPRLTVRDVPCERQPRRAVIDSRLEMKAHARILHGGGALIFTTSDDGARRAALERAGAEVIAVPHDAAKPGKTDLAAVARMLGERGFNEVTVETGARLNGSLIAAGVIDEIVLYLAPRILGDSAQGLFALPGLERLQDAIAVRIAEVRSVGEDLRVTLRLGS
ncbi:MAG TPA: bifunctional diaminohydroxyphosphoribosylaminopyrimidine deaminase/5-amino-6-(5-phosphoribosylamino)uracil reductase RibD [Usitatibacter sp.]|nr:bifunctional diaminohydroxyphosphoribosylaminopyrimidine deaminase/5-amino-6-(5-phosphoribosylamino)uracil reductase RibD [Usitatibacter sp.]